MLDPDRCFAAEPGRRALARRLYEQVRNLPLFCPHGHVPPSLLADPAATWGTPVDVFVLPDHYVQRMLISQGVTPAELGLPARDATPVERDHRRIWQRFADHVYLFRGTPTGLWLQIEWSEVFGIDERLTSANAQSFYDRLAERLADPAYTPRALFRRFGIELLATTDEASADLAVHRRLHADGLPQIRPTFRPDALFALNDPDWRARLGELEAVTGMTVNGYHRFIAALEQQRARFKQHGALASDHGVETPATTRLSLLEAETIFARALRGAADETDAARFTAHMLMESARMSCEDGLVMQLHAGSLRNHHTRLWQQFGPDRGADIPLATEWTRNLRSLLNEYGTDPRLRLILFTLDESTYSRELAPLAGYYPAVRLGPPWWFFDSARGMRRYFDLVIETAGFYNTAGFNDDTRAFPSIPARHDVWRRVACDWLAGQVSEGLLDEDEATELAVELAVGLARRAYRWEE